MFASLLTGNVIIYDRHRIVVKAIKFTPRSPSPRLTGPCIRILFLFVHLAKLGKQTSIHKRVISNFFIAKNVFWHTQTNKLYFITLLLRLQRAGYRLRDTAWIRKRPDSRQCDSVLLSIQYILWTRKRKIAQGHARQLYRWMVPEVI